MRGSKTGQYGLAAARLERLEIVDRLLRLQFFHHEISADVKDFRFVGPLLRNIADGKLRVRARRTYESSVFALHVDDERAAGPGVRNLAHPGNVDERIRKRFQDMFAKRVVADAAAKPGRNFQARKINRNVRGATAKRELDAIRLDEFARNGRVIDRGAPHVGEKNTGG